MPSTYAHYRFGKDVLKKLPEPVRKVIRKEQRLFRIGLHGPDILFYYRPLGSNEVNYYGSRMHQWQGTDVFTEMFEKAQKYRGVEKEAVEIYIYGFLCHFALDCTCHPLVGEWMEKTGVTHSEIETEFDRALMIHDGYDPLSHRPANHVSSDIREAAVIQHIFSGFSVAQVQEALRSTRFYNNFFVAPGKGKRTVVRGLLKLAGKLEKMDGLIVNYHPNEKCRESTQRLILLYRQAVDLAVEMITEMYQSFETGNLVLDEKYERTFEG